LKLDVTQITIVTPHPQTEMWRELDSGFGIFEKDWAKYDTKHLVWNHPNGKPGVLEALLEQRFRLCYGNQLLLSKSKKFLAMRRRQKDFSDVIFGPVRSRWSSPERLPYLTAPSAVSAPRTAAARA
jgi:hypothetical protein